MTEFRRVLFRSDNFPPTRTYIRTRTFTLTTTLTTASTLTRTLTRIYIYIYIHIRHRNLNTRALPSDSPTHPNKLAPHPQNQRRNTVNQRVPTEHILRRKPRFLTANNAALPVVQPEPERI